MPNEPSEHDTVRRSTTGGLPVAPSLSPTLQAAGLPSAARDEHTRILVISAVAIAVAFAAAGIAEILLATIGLITNLSFHGRFSLAFSSPAGNHLGLLVIVVPVIGGVIVGFMARYGSPAIRGHGIPEAMERVLYAESRIAPKVTFWKPVSSAVAIGTGGPFGAEGPIIATGGALGSVVGQFMRITADERKVLLAAGAAAGMAATFGSPVSAVLLAVELLVFEYRARSLVPISLAAGTATAVRMAIHGSAPIFAMPQLAQPGGLALATYVIIGALVGLASVYVTRGVYAIEDAFEKLPVHWMWWPAIGALAVGIVGYFAPHTLGVGYDNIDHILSGDLVGSAVLFLAVMKLISWSIALGSGTSGGTLAPLFTIGGGLGAILGRAAIFAVPVLGVDARIAALVGMASMFAGASRALLASVVFAFETTRQPMGLLPLLGGCAAAYLVSLIMMKNTIMTEKLARRGAPVPTEYQADYLDQILVRDEATRDVVTLSSDETLANVRERLISGAGGAYHNGFPVVDSEGNLVGVVTRRDLVNPEVRPETNVGSVVRRPAVTILETNTLREAADQMVRHRIGRLPVVRADEPRKVVGIVTRSDLLGAHARRLDASGRSRRALTLGRVWMGRRATDSKGDKDAAKLS